MTVAAITGGAGALGSTLAKVLVERGWKVALYDVEAARDRLEQLRKELGPDKVTTHAGDFVLASTWDAALATTKAALGELPTHAALIAGGWSGGKPLHAETDDTTYETMMKSNLDTAYRAMRALLPVMVANERGSIVVVGSRAAVRPWTSSGAAAYAAAKAAVVALAEATAQEVLHKGVRVNAILPSTMDTRANRAAMPKADPSEWVSLESAAKLIAFLFHEDARDITGAAIPIYGRV
jgi:NAD(P)-dependent dehydrogenase (short-subunit alcohol dehydrogenase family)